MEIREGIAGVGVMGKIHSVDQAGRQLQARKFQLDPSTYDSKIPSFSHFLNPIKSITNTSDHIDGFRFEINLPFSPNFSLGHTWNIPTTNVNRRINPKPTYCVNALVAQNFRKGEPGTILKGNMDNEGRLEAYFVQRLARNVWIRLTGAWMNANVEQGVTEADIDVQNQNNRVGFNLLPGILNLSYMQRVTHNLIFGFNYTYREGTSFLGYAAKYKLRSHHFYFQYSPDQYLNLAYSLPVWDKMKFIASFAYSQNKTTTILGLRQKYINSEITATINSRAKLATNLILGGNGKFYSLRLCAIVDYLKETYKFGYGIIIGQNQ